MLSLLKYLFNYDIPNTKTYVLPSLNYDILRLISIYCEPGDLAINHELSTIYNDTWYQDKLELLESKMMRKELTKFFQFQGYKNVYKRYLSIQDNKKSIDIILHIGKYFIKYLLKFNGDLYREKRLKGEKHYQTELID